ncbi:phage major capsid protein [Oenococcus oeni]|uniref:phage major capsid protein n=5 Tax=Oenococcus oeni TaxID=1247 RepID=UPI000277BB63|nr:phage major capsid protein [Oenococcus oeni]EJO04107.1 phage major capsid protein, HK97 family [Oenococcus oeni AWRIB548]EJO04154.1 phage major capsid protein, HK97 family [Oenococcus oeni AWRIB548]KEP86532.1 capsid protein [Oenococcus oeni IOEB_0205]KGH66179.1 capsid protein [Oenococcus oeni IOEB_B16]OIL78084.1 capsid protein [Oenococcus oeni]
MDLNKLNQAFTDAGQQVSDAQDARQKMVFENIAEPGKHSDKELSDLKNKIDNLVATRDAAKDVLEDARKNAVVLPPKDGKDKESNLNNSDKENNKKLDFVKNVRGLIRGDHKVLDMATSSTDESGNAIGLVIPQDIQTAIHTLIRQYDALQQYVNVENVTTQTGSRVYEKWTDVTPLAEITEEGATIGNNDDPDLQTVKYSIRRFAGITTATNSLLSDSDQNVLAWLESWISKKVVVTRNAAIITVFNALPNKPTLAKYDDILDLTYTGIDPAIQSTAFFLTNVSGCNALHKVKNADGDYLLQPNPQNPMEMLMNGKQIKMVADRWLPSAGTTTAPVFPLYYGDAKQAATLFDRQNMSLLSTNIGAGSFETDTTKIRVIDRFDVKPTDTDAFVAASFSAIADQPAKIVVQSAS